MADFVDRALGALHRQRGEIPKARRDGIDPRIEIGGGDEIGQVADAQQLFRRLLLRQHEQPLGVVEAEAGDVAPQPAFVIMHADPRGGHEHHRGRGDADAEIAGQRKVGAAAVDPAMQPGDGRDAEHLQPVDHVLEGRTGRVLDAAGCGLLRHVPQMRAG